MSSGTRGRAGAGVALGRSGQPHRLMASRPPAAKVPSEEVPRKGVHRAPTCQEAAGPGLVARREAQDGVKGGGGRTALPRPPFFSDAHIQPWGGYMPQAERAFLRKLEGRTRAAWGLWSVGTGGTRGSSTGRLPASFWGFGSPRLGARRVCLAWCRCWLGGAALPTATCLPPGPGLGVSYGEGVRGHELLSPREAGRQAWTDTRRCGPQGDHN